MNSGRVFLILGLGVIAPAGVRPGSWQSTGQQGEARVAPGQAQPRTLGPSALAEGSDLAAQSAAVPRGGG